MTYEEFLNKNKISDLTVLEFGDKNIFPSPLISDNPKEYIDIAKKAKNLELIQVSGDKSKEYYENFTEFIKNCNDNVLIANNGIGGATKEEYLKGEEIINKLIESVNPEWNVKQKAAYIHYKMGKLISYMPDFNNVNRDINNLGANNARNIWKSLVDGVSVCNGIVDINKNILSRMGIKAQSLSSGTHSFLLIETEGGNLITDPTWDLKQTLYEARPLYFGKTIEELRKADGKLSYAHRLKNEPENVIRVDEEEVREIYHSIGLTTEDRSFFAPIVDDLSKIKNKNIDSKEERLNELLRMLTENYSEELAHLSETRQVIENYIVALGINERKDIITEYIYKKNDKDCLNPYLALCIKNLNLKEGIQVLDVSEMQFISKNLDEIKEEYKAHDSSAYEPFWKMNLLDSKQPVSKNVDKNR